jgi:DNA-binding response OmpR family regulator
MSQTKILFVEDDETIALLTKEALESYDWEVTHAGDGQKGFSDFKNGPFDLCIFDVMLPKLDGFELAKKVREINQQIPIIFLTAKSLMHDKIKGLTIGADDYITKPFDIEELVLKTKIFLKRKMVVDEKKEVTKISDYSFDPSNLSLSSQEEHHTLTQRESDLLELLLQHKGVVVKREIILERIWGKNDYFLGRSMDVFISRLRKYFKSDTTISIENIHGVGFKFDY